MARNYLLQFIVVILGLLIFQQVFASTTDNVSGWAWSSNIGWISFNCTNRSCTNSNYGVNINPDNGVLSGYAWSSNLGWISFNSSELTGCPQGECIAKVDLNSCSANSCPLVGWARACSVFSSGCSGSLNSNRGDWDGWLKLKGNLYGGILDFQASPKEFQNYFWGGNQTDSGWQGKAIIGWVSLNCQDRGICSTSNYKVVTTAPLNRKPNIIGCGVAGGDYCCAASPPIFVNWIFEDPDGDSQGAYQVQIYQGSTLIHDSGKTNSSSTSYSPPGLGFNKTYTWKVKVWDNRGKESDWYNCPTPIVTFSKAPCADFQYSPSKPALEQVVKFENRSTQGERPIISYFWTFENGDPSTSPDQNPEVVFNNFGANNRNRIVLEISDGVYTCSRTKDISFRLPLPKWKEIKPF
jgi:hypothetical protein